ncbi:hypothetical protein FHR49_002113 [Xanthomonas campestris]
MIRDGHADSIIRTKNHVDGWDQQPTLPTLAA